MKIAVTGATGFLGKALSDELEKLGHVVIRLDSSNFNLRGELQLPHCDVLYHVGGNSKVYLAKRFPQTDFEINAHGSAKLMDALKEAEIPKVIYTSSNTVYKDLIVADEDSPVGINDYGKFYGLSKLVGDLYIRQFAEFFGIDYVIFRPSNFYGPGMLKNVIIDVIKKFLAGSNIEIGFTFNSEIDFIYIDDLVSAHILGLEFKDEIFNLCSGESSKVGDVIRMISYNFENVIDVKEGSNKIVLSQGNKKLCSNGWEPKFGIEEGIKNTVDYFKAIMSNEND